MDIEFHYYMTYLIGTKAGLDPDRARVIAHSAQFIDDNDMIFTVDKDNEPTRYSNYISQTMNILKPKAKLFRIYPLFHFIPGDPMTQSAWRKDGKMHWLNTTPNSANANAVVDAALASDNLYRIGVALHGYADSWAHQNFVGYWDDFNAIKNPLGTFAPNIGHADAGHNPDWAALNWKDERLQQEGVGNKQRFLDAAVHLLAKLAPLADPDVKQEVVATRSEELRSDLERAIGEQDQSNKRSEARVERYRALSLQPAYGGSEVPIYDEDAWFEQAVNENVRGLRDRSDNSLTRFDPFHDVYTWGDRRSYTHTHWHRFQEAVKEQQNAAWDILSERTFDGLELPGM